MGITGGPRVVAVACSGGRDSSALLHATQAAAPVLGIEVLALHVNHRLSAFADSWEAHCRRQCGQAGIAFASRRLATRPARGDSLEAWARSARYEALRQMAAAGGSGLVLLAHHQRDQAETLLLQALRGGGVAGLAGMPREVLRDGIVWARPWLDVSCRAIEAYVARHAIAHVDDDSNADPRFARNRLRLAVWPALAAAFPHAEAALATATGWAQQAAACLDEFAADDLARLDAASPEGASALPLADWQRLPPARRSNVLRGWLRRATGRAATAALVGRLLKELPATGSASWPCGEGWLLRRHRGLLRLAADRPVTPEAAAAPAAPAAAPRPAAISPVGASAARPAALGTAAAMAPAGPVSPLAIRRAGRYRLPGWPGCIVAERVDQGGVPLAWLARLDVRPREGGERFQAAAGRPPRSLKKQFQAAGLAAWERAAPLLFSSGRLVFVPGLGMDARVVALSGQAQLRLHWLPDAAVAAVAATATTAATTAAAADSRVDKPPAKIEG